MINLHSEPVLGSVVLSRNAVWKHVYTLPHGMEFPLGTEARVVFTDRAGGDLGEFYADMGATSATWIVEPDDFSPIPAGSNFEMFIELPDGTFKIRYGRVVRRDPSFPLSPTNSARFEAAMFEDLLQRDMVGPYWTNKSGAVAMHALDGTPANWGMAVRNLAGFLPLTLWENAAVLWYAPVRSDTVEITVGLQDGGDGDCTIVLCSNYTMTNWMGIRFHDGMGSGDEIRAVVGNSPLTMSAQGTGYSHIVPDNGNLYTIRYSLPSNKVSVYIGSNLTPVLEWTDSSHLVTHGMGHRYVGAVWNGSFATPGPIMYYWKAKDDV